MRKQIFFWLTTLLPVFVYAQNKVYDTTEINRILEESIDLAWNDPDSGLVIFNKLLAASKELEFVYGIRSANQILAGAYLSKGDLAYAMYHAQEIINSYDENDPEARISQHSQVLGDIYTELGDYDRAITFYKERLKYTLEHDEENTRLIGNLEFCLARVYSYADQLDSAKVYAEKVFKAYGEIWSSPVLILGEVYVKMGKYEDALKVLNTKVNTSDNYDIDLVNNYIARANAFWNLNNIDSSRFYALTALDEAINKNFLKAINKASETLATTYENSDRELYFKYLQISYTAKDSLYSREKINQVNNFILSDEIRQRDLAAEKEAFRNQTRTNSFFVLTVFLTLIGLVLWRISRVKTKSNQLLVTEKEKVEQALTNLKSTQAQLIQSEKMASLGELTAGIAHEIQNPLNFVNNFSEVSSEMIEELDEEIEKGDKEEAKAISADLRENLNKIAHHGKRADAIVKGMLEHSKKVSGQKEPTDLNVLADEFLRLSYQSFLAKVPDFQGVPIAIGIKTDFDPDLPKVSVIPQDIGKVLLNLMNNAFYACAERSRSAVNEKANSGNIAPDYKPTIQVSTRQLPPESLSREIGRGKGGYIEISVSDNGSGIPDSIKEKIFQPFFTTKPTGSGTGLGLSLSYDIVKAHGGELRVESNDGKGSEFFIEFPI